MGGVGDVCPSPGVIHNVFTNISIYSRSQVSVYRNIDPLVCKILKDLTSMFKHILPQNSLGEQNAFVHVLYINLKEIVLKRLIINT